jgi:glutamine synthetase adenylyltransferase
VFSYSRFLSDAVLRRPERILQVANSGSFYRVLTVEEYEERLYDFLGATRAAFRGRVGALPAAPVAAHRAARRAGRGHARRVTEELSSLADAILMWPTAASATISWRATASRAWPMAAPAGSP